MNFRLKDGSGMEFLPWLSKKTSFTVLYVTNDEGLRLTKNFFSRHKLGHT